MNLNEMNDAWIAQGQKVSDLNDKINTSLLDDSVDEDAIKDLKAKRDQAKARRDEMKNQLEEMKAQEAVHTDNLKNQPVKDDKKMSDSIKFIKMFKDMAHGHITDVIKESVTDPGQTGNGGLLVSNDEQTKINELRRQQANLQTLVTVESVSKPKGSRVVDKNEDLVAMPVVNEGDTLPDLDDPKLDRLSYTIKDRGGIFTATNDQLNDSDQNTLAWLEQKIAKYTGFSRSQDVLAVLPKMTKKATISSFDDIKDLENNTIDPSLMSGAIFLTNQSGFNILSKVKDAQGRYLLQADVSNPDVYRIGGKQVVWFADNIVPMTRAVIIRFTLETLRKPSSCLIVKLLLLTALTSVVMPTLPTLLRFVLLTVTTFRLRMKRRSRLRHSRRLQTKKQPLLMNREKLLISNEVLNDE